MELKYWPSCLTIGLIGSAIGLCAFAAAWYLSERYRKQHLAAGCPVYVPCNLNAEEACVGEAPEAETFAQIQLEMQETPPALPEEDDTPGTGEDQL
ncbi:MAG: hypothetical protein KHW59_08740 [Clostridiales bacterium]|nr:hypothetical protein [Clostridiales bacterium]